MLYSGGRDRERKSSPIGSYSSAWSVLRASDAVWATPGTKERSAITTNCQPAPLSFLPRPTEVCALIHSLTSLARRGRRLHPSSVQLETVSAKPSTKKHLFSFSRFRNFRACNSIRYKRKIVFMWKVSRDEILIKLDLLAASFSRSPAKEGENKLGTKNVCKVFSLLARSFLALVAGLSR